MADFVGLRNPAYSTKYENWCLQENNNSDIHTINHLCILISCESRIHLNVGSSTEGSDFFKFWIVQLLGYNAL
jgi:hypothetical protein